MRFWQLLRFLLRHNKSLNYGVHFPPKISTLVLKNDTNLMATELGFHNVMTPESGNSTSNMAISLNAFWKREQERIAQNYRKTKGEYWWTFGLILAFAFMIGYGLWGKNSLSYYAQNWQNLSFLALLFPVLVWIILKLSLLLRWVLYWAVITAMLLFVVRQRDFGESYDQVARVILISFVVIESVTLAVYLYTRVLYVKTLSYITDRWPNYYFKIQPHPTKNNHYTSNGFLEMSRKQKVFSYVGEKDQEGHPHGFGTWTSQWPMGEVLTGYFEHGRPIGPFRAREYKSGYAFRNLRIGFVATTGSLSKNTLKREDEITYGVASIECSIAGRFFSDLPRCQLLFDCFSKNSKKIQNISDVLSNLKPMQSDLDPRKSKSDIQKITVEVCQDIGFKVSGFSPIIGEEREVQILKLSRSAMELTVEGWKRRRVSSEAVLFVPGFNCTLKEALELLGQMIALGNLSPEYKPLIFNWPGGSLLQYPQAIILAEQQQIRDDFVNTVRNLAKSGISKVHILCHSLGARVVMNASADFYKCFRLISQQSNDDLEVDGLIELGSMTIMNPEAPLDIFKSVRLPNLKFFTDLVTVYANNGDVALTAAEFYNWKKMLGCRGSMLYDIDQESGEKKYLDVDVVDTTELDTNVQGAKHSFFFLNKVYILINS
jgi:hypothetical protein